MIGRLICYVLEDLIRNISGPLGIRLRRFYYKRRLGAAGWGLVIDTGVSFESPNNIYIGDRVWVDKNCIFIAGKIKEDAAKIFLKPSAAGSSEGVIRVGSFSHIGVGTIIQGHGGVTTGDYFTSSAGCRIYSFSNDYRNSRTGTVSTNSSLPAYIMGAVIFGKNVWIGLGVSVISAEIGDNTFVLPHAVVFHSLDSNGVAGGNPAERIRNRFPE
jgi:acetyltransferase-like isoleucine patch superfamily enzyme